jgi:enterobacterial common antigen flippase
LSKNAKHSYGQILKSSALIGGSSILSICFRIVRTKAIAVFLGPTGVGLLGVFDSISELTRTIAGLGINTSGVRQIAEAVGTGDASHLARTVKTLRRVALYSGAAGALLLLLFSRPIAEFTFGNHQQAGAVALLALAVFFGDVSQGQAALVQGMRRIADLARINVLGAFYGTIFSIPIIYFYREQGLVPSLVCVAAMGILTSWWYARKIQVARVSLTWRETFSQTSALLKLGVVLMLSGLMTMGTMYLVRIILLRSEWAAPMTGIEAAGFYQAAWGFGGLYIGFIVQAMGADFYPRLTAVANDHAQCTRLVNEQAEVGLLLAVPGVLATLTFAPAVLQLFYSDKFGPAVEILRWICLGMVLRVASWPMGFVLLAKDARKIFFWVEFTSNLIYLAFIWIGMKNFGLRGTGIAFFGLYTVTSTGLYFITRHLSGFVWSAANRKLALCFAPLLAIVFVSWYILPRPVMLVLGGVVTCFTGVFSLKILCTLVPLERFPGPVRQMISFLRLAPPVITNNHPD